MGYDLYRVVKEKRARFGKLGLEGEERITAGLAHHRAPAWSSDGKHLVFSVGTKDDSAWTVVDRHGRVARTLEGPADGTACFTPDGGIAFERRFGATTEVWLTPGSDLPAVRILGGDGALYCDPTLSPDGATLACATSVGPVGSTHLVLVSLATGSRLVVTGMPQRADRHPGFSPDGKELVFEGIEGTDHGIFVAHLQRNTVTRLTAMEERARRPIVIDDRLVVYERHEDSGHVRLCLLERGDDATSSRSHVIVDDDTVRIDAACWVGRGGKVKLAWAAQCTIADGEPPRFDIHVARLRGVTATIAPDEETRSSAARAEEDPL